jgi:hypothetical protein
MIGGVPGELWHKRVTNCNGTRVVHALDLERQFRPDAVTVVA